MTADVVFMVGMKRQSNDTRYRGFMTQLKLLGIHYTRCRVRAYAFLHDMTAGIELPPGGKEHDRGIRLGAPRSCFSREARNADTRHQLFYLEMKVLAHKVWYEAFRVDKRLIRTIALVAKDIVRSISRHFPFVHSTT